jgi:hypothetical protein
VSETVRDLPMQLNNAVMVALEKLVGGSMEGGINGGLSTLSIAGFFGKPSPIQSLRPKSFLGHDTALAHWQPSSRFRLRFRNNSQLSYPLAAD